MSHLLQTPSVQPHFKPITLISVTLQPVPLFTKVRYLIYLSLTKLCMKPFLGSIHLIHLFEKPKTECL